MEFIFIIVWLVLCGILANMGSSRKIGGAGAFFISLFFSPLVGLIVVLSSSPKSKKDININNPAIFKLSKEALVYYNKKDHQKAKELWLEALALDGNFANSHYCLASVYSMLEDKKNAFKHLSRAVESGYNDFSKIQKTPSLAYLRSQEGYKDFVSNGYKFVNSDSSKNYIEEIKELAELKEKGILTENEFNEKKAKLLSSNT